MESYRNGGRMEVDLLLVNTQEIAVIEVKTTLKVEYLNEEEAFDV